jgi:hypothetical protein
MSETNGTEQGPEVIPAASKRGRPRGSKNKVRLVDTINCPPVVDKIVINKRMKQKASEDEVRRYVELVNAVHEDITTAQNALHRLAENLAIIHRDRLYYAGGYATFGDFARAEIGSRTRAYYLLDAREVLGNLLAAGFTEGELPDKERLCREIVKLSTIDQVKVWKLLRKTQEETGKEPTSDDVDEAVQKLSERDSAQNPEPDEDRDEKQMEKLITDWSTAAKKFKVGLSVASLTKSNCLRLAAILTEVQDSISRQMATITHREQQEQEDGNN